MGPGTVASSMSLFNKPRPSIAEMKQFRDLVKIKLLERCEEAIAARVTLQTCEHWLCEHRKYVCLNAGGKGVKRRTYDGLPHSMIVTSPLKSSQLNKAKFLTRNKADVQDLGEQSLLPEHFESEAVTETLNKVHTMKSSLCNKKLPEDGYEPHEKRPKVKSELIQGETALETNCMLHAEKYETSPETDNTIVSPVQDLSSFPINILTHFNASTSTAGSVFVDVEVHLSAETSVVKTSCMTEDIAV